jgi:hypothetical protein
MRDECVLLFFANKSVYIQWAAVRMKIRKVDPVLSDDAAQ